MVKVPAIHKERIQRAQFRLQKLDSDWTTAREKASWSAWLKWGGLLLLLACFFQRYWPDWIGGAGLLGAIAGWAINSDAKQASSKAANEAGEIRQGLREIGIIVPHTGRTYYLGKIETGNEFDPLDEGAYAPLDAAPERSSELEKVE